MDEAQRVHEALETAAERLAGTLEGARFEQREGYTFLAFPTFPMGESVYRRLGFREIETYTLYGRPRKVSVTS